MTRDRCITCWRRPARHYDCCGDKRRFCFRCFAEHWELVHDEPPAGLPRRLLFPSARPEDPPDALERLRAAGRRIRGALRRLLPKQ